MAALSRKQLMRIRKVQIISKVIESHLRVVGMFQADAVRYIERQWGEADWQRIADYANERLPKNQPRIDLPSTETRSLIVQELMDRIKE